MVRIRFVKRDVKQRRIVINKLEHNQFYSQTEISLRFLFIIFPVAKGSCDDFVQNRKNFENQSRKTTENHIVFEAVVVVFVFDFVDVMNAD